MRFSKFFLVSTRYVFDKAILLPVISAVKKFIFFGQTILISAVKFGILFKLFHSMFDQFIVQFILGFSGQICTCFLGPRGQLIVFETSSFTPRKYYDLCPYAVGLSDIFKSKYHNIFLQIHW